MRVQTERLVLEPISMKHLQSTWAYASDLEKHPADEVPPL